MYNVNHQSLSGLFKIVVAVAVQSAFRLKIYQNNFFSFKKNYF